LGRGGGGQPFYLREFHAEPSDLIQRPGFPGPTLSPGGRAPWAALRELAQVAACSVPAPMGGIDVGQIRPNWAASLQSAKKKKNRQPWALRCALLGRKWPWAIVFALVQQAQKFFCYILFVFQKHLNIRFAQF